LESYSFLIRRFRPGAEIASVLFLVRNALVVLCPLATSTPGQLAMMNLIFYVPGCELALHRLSGIFAELDGPGVCANIISYVSYMFRRVFHRPTIIGKWCFHHGEI
jgi:hypothetical protein